MEISPAVRVIFFDFDGTLVDSFAAITASVNHVRAHHGLPPLEQSEVRCYVGRGPEYLLNHTIGVGSMSDNLSIYRAHHPSVMHEKTVLLPGALEAVRAANKSGRRVGICSNKPRFFTKELVAHLDIGEYIDAIFGPEDVSRLKPAPDMLRKGLEWMKVQPSEALYVGDMVVDIETGLGAGVTVWAVPTGCDDLRTLETAGPDRILKDLFELAELLDKEPTTGQKEPRTKSQEPNKDQSPNRNGS